jgi:hypothetical protein
VPFGTILAAGWTSGLNLYGTALLLGIAGRLGWADTPEELQHGWVLGVLAALYAVEFVADKVPFLDSAWDAVHTVIRPIGGGLLGIALAGGGLSMTAQAARTTTRAAVNTSPEPFSNVAVSFLEDGVVAGVVALALAAPVVAGVVAVVLALTSILLAAYLVRVVRRFRARFRPAGSARG